jgi:hypothetical protein
VHHEESWSPDTEGGFMGVGEGGVIGVLPADQRHYRRASWLWRAHHADSGAGRTW